MSAPSIPNTFYLYPDLSGGVDVGLENINVTGLPLIKLEATVKALPKIVTDNTVKMGLDDIRVKELPTVHLELSVAPTRVHYPGHYKLCAAIFGVEFFSLAVCGESMAIAEPYEPHKTEICH
jgi:hypothetical protein